MLAPALRNRNIMQLCWVVPDLHAAMASWTKSAGVGPFFYFDNVPVVDPIYRGKTGPVPPITAAIAQAGDMQIELVAQESDERSIWTELVPKGKTGFHHCALYCKDYDAELKSYLDSGAELALSIKMMGARTCWLDTVAQLGFMMELVEANPVAEKVFAAIREAGHTWDGKDPVRTLG
jgi:hypothetical protein